MTIHWIKVLPGNVLKGAFHINKDKELKISDSCRMAMEKKYDGKTDIVYFLEDNCTTLGWIVDKTTTYEKITIPPMSREFTSLAVKGSVWEFERDWVCQGYDISPKVYTIKAGTQITVANSKMQIRGCNYYIQEKCLEIEPNPVFSMFPRSYQFSRTDNKKNPSRFIPAKEVSQYLKLVTPGKIKTYWRMETADGELHVKKNFATLSALKASVRVRFNLHKSQDEDAYTPEWLENDSGWMKRPDHTKGVWAVQYDHATKKEVAREDLLGMVIAAALST